MQVIELETKIAAPVERCFLLSLSVDLHTESTEQTGERAIAGVTHGLMGPGETVTWRGRHFGFMLTHQSLITAYDRPRYFQDVMVRGMFRLFEHDHFFELVEGGTLMRDRLRFAAPFGLVGVALERLVLRAYFVNFLKARNELIRHIAESEESVWSRYVEER